MEIKSEARLTFFEATSIIIGHGVGAGILSVPFIASRNSLVDMVWIMVLVYFINALSWNSVILGTKSDDEHVSLRRVFRLTITGYALNYATPVGGLGGEPWRIMELSRNMDKHRATSSVILYAMMHVFAHFWLWFTSIFFYIV